MADDYKPGSFSQERCQWCHYWQDGFDIPTRVMDGAYRARHLLTEFDCRKRSPIADPNPHGNPPYQYSKPAVWAKTRGQEWCGEFKLFTEKAGS